MSQQKAKETVQKYKELLDGKTYEFSQKIIALANRYKLIKHFKNQNRKATIGNFQESISLYLEASKELLQVKEINEANNLIQNVFEILKKDKQFANEELKSELMSIYSLIPQGQIKLKIANRLLNEFYLGDLEICREVAIDLFNNQLYHIAQKYIVNLNDAELSINFLHKWVEGVKCDVEVEFFVIRYILAQILNIIDKISIKIGGQKLDEAQTILNNFKKDTPFYNFTCNNIDININSFLLRACKIKSRKAYSKLTSKYNDILKTDPSIQQILKRIASIYFGYEKESGSGIEGLFSNLLS